MQDLESNRSRHHGDGGHHHSDTEIVGATDDEASIIDPLEKRGGRQSARFVSTEVRKPFSSKRANPTRFDRTKSHAAQALEGLEFISKTDGGAAGWSKVEKKFDQLTTNTNGLLPRRLFGESIGMARKDANLAKIEKKKNDGLIEFAGNLFDALGRRRNIIGDSIDKAQFRDFWDQITDHSFDSRFQIFFDMVDKDADGKLTEQEISEIIRLSALANDLSTVDDQAAKHARLIMNELDPDNLGYIKIEHLEALLLEAQRHTAATVRRVETRRLHGTLSLKLKESYYYSLLKRWYRDSKYFVMDYWQRFWVMALWIGAMAGLFTYKYIQYKNRAAFDVMGHCVCMAKGAAETLKLNMALILLPVCRNTITWLRNKTRLGAAVPFDDNISFHKIIAIAIAIAVGIHTISHLVCDFPKLLNASPEKYRPMEQFFGEQPTSYWHFVKGVEGVTGIVMVVLMSIAFILASPWLRQSKSKHRFPLNKLSGFNAFWYSHHLFVAVYSLLIVHGIKLYLTREWYKKTTWMYLAIPILLYAGERLTRAFRSTIEAVKILKVAYPRNVLAIHMSKPQGFRYESGQYMFVNCAAVSPFEWHPFSITSAPGDDYLSVHMRSAGDWTEHIRTVFYQVCPPPPNGESGLLTSVENNPNTPKVLIDGPYGAPAQEYKKYDVVLLVGLGIGATPMISIVKDIVNNIKAMGDATNLLEAGSGGARTPPPPVPSTQRKTGSGNGANDFRTERAYFYWVTREQWSFDWFKGIMNEVAEMDQKGVIEMHNYCTSVYEEGDVRSALISMLQSINHAKNGVDIVSGTRFKSHFAKPDWDDVYKRVALNHPHQRIGVFYCGMPAVAKKLKQRASYYSHNTSTIFDFHKENF